MSKLLAHSIGLLILPALTTAQCLTVGSGTPAPVPNWDEAISPHMPMNIIFPMVGAAGPYTHCRVNTNGVLYLTDGSSSSDIHMRRRGLPTRWSGGTGRIRERTWPAGRCLRGTARRPAGSATRPCTHAMTTP